MTSEKTFRRQQKALAIVAAICLVISIMVAFILWQNEITKLTRGFLKWIVFPTSIVLNIFFILYFIFNPQDDGETAEEKREYGKSRHWDED